jgi:hypothetical protein
MDQKLLSALNNLSEGLEAIAEALKESGGNKSATTSALQGGSFTKEIQEINVGVKQLMKDSKQILKNQETIISLSKKSAGDKKSDFEKAGGDKKKESDIKKGIGTILLIAVAVLAIGMAFKLVGKIDFLSVVGLGLAMLIMSEAFSKIARLKISLKEAAIASLVMVMIAIAVTLSSWVLKMITPIGMAQLFTGIAITVMFYIMAPKFAMLLNTVNQIGRKISYGDILKVGVILVAMSVAITLSSWVLRFITPLTIGQIITGIGITAMFYVVSNFLPKLAISVIAVSKIMSKKDLALLPIMLVAFSIAITLSSWVLRMIAPMSFGQIITGIAITAMFWIVANFLPKLAFAVIAVSKIMSKKDLVLLPLMMVAFSIAIMLSSLILKLIKPLSFGQIITTIVVTAVFWAISMFLTDIAIGVIMVDKILGKNKIWMIPLVYVAISAAIMVAGFLFSKTPELGWKQMVGILLIGLIFAGLAYVMPDMAIGLVIMEKALGKGKMWLIPLVYVAIAAAIMLSSHILNASAEIPWMKLLNILVFSVVLVIAVALIGLLSLFLVKVIGLTTILKGSLCIVAIATAIMLTSWALNKGSYKKYPDWKWTLFAALAVVVFGLIGWLLMKIGGVGTYIKGGIAILAVAATVMATSHIVNMGNYKNYPKLGWTLGVGASLLAFGIAMGVLGLIVTSGVGLAVLAAGALGVLGVAATIVAASHILAQGKYGAGKYPSLGWSLGVGLALTAFGGGMVLLGGLIIASFGVGGLMLAAGAKAVLKVAETIVKSSHILAKGNWKKGPTKEWASGVAIALGAFSPIYTMLMNNAPGLFSSGGGVGPNEFAKSIVTVTRGIITAATELASPKNKGVWKKGPTKEWATGVGIALNAFGPIYGMLLKNAPGIFTKGGGIGPNEFAKAIVTVTRGIVTAAKEFASPDNKGIWKKAPTKEWAQGVGLALGAFMPIYAMLMNNASMKAWTGKGGVGPEAFSKAVVTVSKGIIAAAKEFAKNTAPFKDGMYPSVKWGQGVGAALNAFAPLFKALHEDTGFFTSGQDVIDNMVNGIVSIAGAIVRVAKKFSDPSISWKSYPDKNWATHIKMTALRYIWAVKKVNEEGVDFISLSIFDSLVDRLARTARIMGKNQQYFNAKINPNFMKSISSNLFYYMAVAEKLKSKQGIGSMLKGALMGDPITNIANGMLQLAKAYDKLAISLSKLGKSMNGINDKKIAQMERMARMAKGQNKGMLGSIGDAVGNVAGAVGGLVSGALNMVTPGGPGSKSSSKEKEKVGKYGNIHKQNDMIIELLMELNGKIGAGSNIDTAMLKKLNEKKDSKLQ